MSGIILLAVAFIAFKCGEEEYRLLKSGAAIDIAQWRSFFRAKYALCRFCTFMTGIAFFFAGIAMPRIFLLAAIQFTVMAFGPRLVFRIVFQH